MRREVRDCVLPPLDSQRTHSSPPELSLWLQGNGWTAHVPQQAARKPKCGLHQLSSPCAFCNWNMMTLSLWLLAAFLANTLQLREPGIVQFTLPKFSSNSQLWYERKILYYLLGGTVGMKLSWNLQCFFKLQAVDKDLCLQDMIYYSLPNNEIFTECLLQALFCYCKVALIHIHLLAFDQESKLHNLNPAQQFFQIQPMKTINNSKLATTINTKELAAQQMESSLTGTQCKKQIWGFH